MSKPHELRCYDYVNKPYAAVCAALREDLKGVLQRATVGAERRAQTIAAELKVSIGPLDIGTEVTVKLGAIEEKVDGVQRGPAMHIRLSWQATHATALLPSMEADLVVYPLSATETQIDLRGVYKPPLGAVGAALDSLIGHRLAEASVRRFVEDIAALLRSE